MSEYVIVTDSSCDLSQEMVEELGVYVLPLRFTIQDKTLRNYPDNRDMAPEEFYQLIRDGEMATTAAVNMAEYIELIEPLLQQGKDVLVLAFSSGLSATCQAAFLAAEELGGKYPDRKLCVVDTLSASLGQGLFVWHAVEKQRAGATLDELKAWAEEYRFHQCHWFTVDDLMHLKRGGRVSATTAMVGTMLNIKPVLHMDDEGHLINMSKARGRKASLDALVDKAGELGTDLKGQTIFISHADSEADARYVGEKMKEKYGVGEVYYNFIGPVIGAHTGCGCVALFFAGEHR